MQEHDLLTVKKMSHEEAQRGLFIALCALRYYAETRHYEVIGNTVSVETGKTAVRAIAEIVFPDDIQEGEI